MNNKVSSAPNTYGDTGELRPNNVKKFSMPTQKNRIDFRQFVHEAAVREHTELWDAWKMIEAKAQSVSGATGVFLAGVFAYASKLPADSSMLERSILIFVAAMLVCAIVQALRAIWVIKTASPHLGLDAKAEVDQILKATQPHESMDARYENLLNDTATRWTSACATVREDLNRKSQLLVTALRILACAAVTVFFLLIVSIGSR